MAFIKEWGDQMPGLFDVETSFPSGPLTNCFSTPWLSNSEYASTSPTSQRSKLSEAQSRLNSTTAYKSSFSFLNSARTYCCSIKVTLPGTRVKPERKFPWGVCSTPADG